MESSEFLVMCSGQPGFLRGVGAQLAGKCRLLECYSLLEAVQLVQLHGPAMALADLRRATPQQYDRVWAMILNSRRTFLVVVSNYGELDGSHIPDEVAARVIHVEVDRATGELSPVIEAITNLIAGKPATVAMRNQVPTVQLSSAPDDSQFRRDFEIPNSTADMTTGGTKTAGTTTTTFGVPHPQKPLPVSREDGISPLAIEPHRSSSRPPIRHESHAGLPDLPTIAERYRTRTPALRQVLDRLEVAARHDVTILLIGETGSGKTHLARLIHESSPRRPEPLLTVACGALPGELIESELFGHVKGAFTSAHADKEGKFLAAGSGTILLDEIDVLTPEQQVKLLRVIEKGLFEPVGSNQTLQVKARIIAASNLELQPLVEQGRFRPDLYYRLNTLSFQIPPLRKRLPDIEPLARYFVHLHADKHGIEVAEISDDFIECLIGYPWPGNVREMENAIRSAVIYSHDGRLTLDTLPPNIVSGAAGPANDPSVASFFGARKGASLGNRIELTEKDIIEQALLNNSFSRTRTARQLGISRVTLYNKMKKYGMMPAN